MEDRSGSSGLAPMRRHSRSRSQGGQGLDDSDANREHTICPGQLPPHLPPSYASHLRSSSRISWDGRLPEPGTRSPSPAPSPSQSPSQSPVIRSNRERPCSAISLPGHALTRPTVLRDRWSYDRERMPTPPPMSRPGTPLSEASVFPSSRPASTFIESRPSSRPQSIIFNPSADLSGLYMPSTPTLRVLPPLDGLADPAARQDRDGPSRPGSRQSQQFRDRHPYHLLTPTELEMLSHPPPASTPEMSPLPSPTAKPTAGLGAPNQETKDHRGYTAPNNSDNDEEKDKPGCLGLCEIATARRIGGTFGAWLMGTLIPVTFGVVTGCVAAATSCR